MYAFTYSKEHGIRPDSVSMPVQVDTFHIRRMLHFQQVSALTGVSVEMLKNLNPQYVHDIIPGTAKEEYILRLPYQYTAKFIDNEDSVYTYKANEFFSPATLKNIAVSGSASSQRVAYKVKSGDYLGKIASRYHVTVKQLMEWNHLRSTNLRVGQVLYIYGKFNGPVASSGSKASSGSNASSSGSKSSSSGSKSSSSNSSASSSNSSAAGSKDSATGGSSSSAGASKSGSSASGGANSSASNGSNAASSASGVNPPADSAPEGSYVIYTVKSGDTLYGIAQSYPGVSADDIMKFNGIGTDIRPGMKLKIPKK
ncbi:MAG: LysM peptidoglycan-binding domain-containing protein, partial [Candidatus Cryptobacteroides sp.]